MDLTCNLTYNAGTWRVVPVYLGLWLDYYLIVAVEQPVQEEMLHAELFVKHEEMEFVHPPKEETDSETESETETESKESVRTVGEYSSLG